jgi:type III pantothenate kinase
MKVDVVVDVGNTRIKWGRCLEGAVVERVSLSPDNMAWQKQLKEWGISEKLHWALSGVYPTSRDRLAAWLDEHGHQVTLIKDHEQLSLLIDVQYRERVGIDRLLNAVAALSRVGNPQPSIIVDAGSAVTVDWVSEKGVFQGGAIFPGFRLMSRSLKFDTAQLPLVHVTETNPRLPGKNTEMAIQAGIFWAVAGGIKALIRQLVARHGSTDRKIFLTGGDAGLLAPVMDTDVVYWPEMTLEGLRIAAEQYTGGLTPPARQS